MNRLEYSIMTFALKEMGVTMIYSSVYGTFNIAMRHTPYSIAYHIHPYEKKLRAIMESNMARNDPWIEAEGNWCVEIHPDNPLVNDYDKYYPERSMEKRVTEY